MLARYYGLIRPGLLRDGAQGHPPSIFLSSGHQNTALILRPLASHQRNKHSQRLPVRLHSQILRQLCQAKLAMAYNAVLPTRVRFGYNAKNENHLKVTF